MMQPRILQNGVLPDAQQKIIEVNTKLGNTGIARQQGTTRSIYDSLPMDGNTTLRFFQGAAQRSFPFTNMGSFGNKLEVGESLVVQRAYFTVFTVDTGSTPVEVTDLTDFDGIGETGLYKGEIQLEIANQIVMKPVPLTSFFNLWNYRSFQSQLEVFHFSTKLIIPPLLEFVWTVNFPSYTAVADTFIGLHTEGVGSIISTRINL